MKEESKRNYDLKNQNKWTDFRLRRAATIKAHCKVKKQIRSCNWWYKMATLRYILIDFRQKIMKASILSALEDRRKLMKIRFVWGYRTSLKNRFGPACNTFDLRFMRRVRYTIMARCTWVASIKSWNKPKKTVVGILLEW
jgi:hypothetical protein